MTFGQIILAVLFWIAECVAFPFFIKLGYPKATQKGFWFKMLSSTIFVCYGLFLLFCVSGEKTLYGELVVVGLLLGLVGDVFLSIDPFLPANGVGSNPLPFYIVGGLSFLAGHILYVIAYLKELHLLGHGLGFRTVLLLLIPFMCIVILKSVLRISLGKLTALVLLYAAVLCFMFSCAATLGSYLLPEQPIPALSLMLGSALFVISDGTLALIYFGGNRFKTFTSRVINLAPYFIAQMLIAGSVLIA